MTDRQIAIRQIGLTTVRESQTITVDGCVGNATRRLSLGHDVTVAGDDDKDFVRLGDENAVTRQDGKEAGVLTEPKRPPVESEAAHLRLPFLSIQKGVVPFVSPPVLGPQLEQNEIAAKEYAPPCTLEFLGPCY